MTKTLINHDSELALVIDRSLLELLGIDSATQLELTTDGDRLIVSPVRDVTAEAARREKLRVAVEDANARYGNALRNLAK